MDPLFLLQKHCKSFIYFNTTLTLCRDEFGDVLLAYEASNDDTLRICNIDFF